jgi:hypothetical protein
LAVLQVCTAADSDADGRAKDIPDATAIVHHDEAPG